MEEHIPGVENNSSWERGTEAISQQVKCAALEESIQRAHDKEDSHQQEMKEMEESVKKIMEEEYKRELEESQKKFNKELQKKEESMRQELFEREKRLEKEAIEEQEKHVVKIMEKEDQMKQQLLDREETFNHLLAELRQLLETRAQQWALVSGSGLLLLQSNRIRRQMRRSRGSLLNCPTFR